MPHISPNKSVEGFVAQLMFGVGLCTFFKALQVYFDFELLPMSWASYVISGLCVSLFGCFGDILESFVKRMGGVKDSGIFFPGHGGILDRFDTFLLACPTTFYYLLFFATDGAHTLYA